MKKAICSGLCVMATVFSFTSIRAQAGSWHQQVNYKIINVALNDRQHTFKGFVEIEDINNSPDALNFIGFHLWPNAYKNENTAFAWFADKDFVIRYDTLTLMSGRVVDVFSYHHPKGAANWIKSTEFIKSGARAYSNYFGEYAYPVVQAVEGPLNEMSGGMEYPMITLITSPNAKDETLDAVITHEVGHNWLCMMLASNESDHAWMDERINTYLQFRSLQTYFNTWKFKHPHSEDFRAVVEKEMNEDLSNYFQLLQKTGNL